MTRQEVSRFFLNEGYEKIALMGSFSLKQLLPHASSHNGWKILRIPTNEAHYFLATHGFDLHDPPIEHLPRSQARYMASYRNCTNQLLLQLLPPRAHTSRHLHRKETERFRVLVGSATLYTPTRVIQLSPKTGTFSVNPQNEHQLVTTDKWALTLIEINNIEEGQELNHVYI